MAAELVHLTSADYEDAMDFMDLVFSQAHRPHDFADLMPTACRPEEEYMRRNLAIKRDGKIRALVLCSPCEVSVAGNTLKMAGIGNVSTHKREG
ncbi:MAG: GNAT family N-acetyltransferase, partial [Clostridia bacterium]|nr:GNAT family N-acetyltransferase [Clostridia bacterium]